MDLSDLYSTSAILIDLDTGEVLAQRNPSQIIYPASLTKMMTVLVALENIEDTSASVTLSPDIFPPLYEEGASMAGFEPGETATTGISFMARFCLQAESAVRLLHRMSQVLRKLLLRK